jgi:hypothetical protein
MSGAFVAAMPAEVSRAAWAAAVKGPCWILEPAGLRERLRVSMPTRKARSLRGPPPSVAGPRPTPPISLSLALPEDLECSLLNLLNSRPRRQPGDHPGSVAPLSRYVSLSCPAIRRKTGSVKDSAAGAAPAIPPG